MTRFLTKDLRSSALKNLTRLAAEYPGLFKNTIKDIAIVARYKTSAFNSGVI